MNAHIEICESMIFWSVPWRRFAKYPRIGYRDKGKHSCKAQFLGTFSFPDRIYHPGELIPSIPLAVPCVIPPEAKQDVQAKGKTN